jgi:hypothetical protein
MIKFDSNRAWKHASATLKANRDIVLALGGVFLFLPSFALVMLAKQPQIAAGGTPEQMAAALQPYIATMGPWVVIGTVIQSLGQLALIALFGRGGQSTVGQALRRAVEGMATYIAFYLVAIFLMSILLSLVMALGSLLHPVVGLVLATYAACQFYARFMATGAVIVLEERLNPIAAMMRSWTLTRRNGWRIGHFVFLLVIAALVVLSVLSMVVGIITALTMGQGRTAEIVSGFVSSALAATMLAYLAAIIVAVYRQLAGDTADQARATFE